MNEKKDFKYDKRFMKNADKDDVAMSVIGRLESLFDQMANMEAVIEINTGSIFDFFHDYCNVAYQRLYKVLDLIEEANGGKRLSIIYDGRGNPIRAIFETDEERDKRIY